MPIQISKACAHFSAQRRAFVQLLLLTSWLLGILVQLASLPRVGAMRPDRRAELRRETVDMFYHGFDNYMRVAFPEDELRPVSCTPLTRDARNPRNVELNDVLGNYSLTLIDSLSTLAILASAPPDDRKTGPTALRDFQDGVAALVEQYGDGRAGPSGRGLRARGFDVDSKVQVFETVIRGVGGLLSAHLFAIGALPITGYDPSRPGQDTLALEDLEARPIRWPNGLDYDGQMLRLALDLAQRILPAFYTKTGMPYPRVNLRHGIPFYSNSPIHALPSSIGAARTDGPPEITETCSAGAGSLVLEFTVLSRLTGDQRFEQLAKRAFWAVWSRKSQIGLIGAGVDAENGHWIGSSAVIGAGADSFFEYALKSHILLSGHDLPNRTVASGHQRQQQEQARMRLAGPGSDFGQLALMDPNSLFPPLSDVEDSPETFLDAWHQAHAAIKRHLYNERDHPHYENVNLWTGSLTSYWVDSLGAYYSGLLALAGEVDEAIETNLLYTAIWTRFGALPERWSLREKSVEGGLGWWPLRPEFIESTYHLFRATRDVWYLYVGEMVQRDIKNRCWTPCGWAGLQDVVSGEQSDRMESFFLGETAKYMYLLFDESHPLNSLDDAFVFTTEGHPLLIPRQRSRTGRSRRDRGRKDIIIYSGEGFTNTCPAPPLTTPLTGSVLAAREDIFHAARMLDLHLLGDPQGAAKRGGNHQQTQATPATYGGNFFPWTLPSEMLPGNGTCAKVFQPIEATLEFASGFNQGSGGSNGGVTFMMASQFLERLETDLIRVQSLTGLKLTLRLEEPEELDGGGSERDREWRISKINGIPLGKDEFVVMDRAILGEIADPRFNLVRDQVLVKLQHLHRVNVDWPVNDAPAAGGQEGDSTTEQISLPSYHALGEQAGSDLGHCQAEFDHTATKLSANVSSPTSRVAELGHLVKSLLNRMAASLERSAAIASNNNAHQTSRYKTLPTGKKGPDAATSQRHGPSLPYNLVINQTALTPTGIGAAPVPPADVPPGTRFPSYGPIPAGNGLLPWSTVFTAAGGACSGPLPDAAPRDHQVIIMRRGGCSFSAKLANIPAYQQSPRSLQLVIVVSDDDDDTATDAEEEGEIPVGDGGWAVGSDYKAYALGEAGLGGGSGRSSSSSSSSSKEGQGSSKANKVAGGNDKQQQQQRNQQQQQQEKQRGGDRMIRPLLDQPQRSPGGLPRRHPVAMVMVGGGEAAYRRLAGAERFGLARRYFIETSGTRVRNLIVDEGDAGVGWI